MSGKRYLLDTNAIIQVFKGHRGLIAQLNRAEFVATSVISELEFLSYPLLTDDDIAEYELFRNCIKVFDLQSDCRLMRSNILKARKSGLRLPDAIIAGTARANGLSVLTADDHFKKLDKEWNVEFYDADGKL